MNNKQSELLGNNKEKQVCKPVVNAPWEEGSYRNVIACNQVKQAQRVYIKGWNKFHV